MINVKNGTGHVSRQHGRLKAADRDFVARFLNEHEDMLFNQMALRDQRRCLRTANLIVESSVGRDDIRLLVLVKAALLLDIGRVRGYAGPWQRMAVRIIRKLMPRYQAKNANRDGDRLARALYADLNHPSTGAYTAQTLGTSTEVVDLIRRHHDPPSAEDSPELVLLRQADKKS